MWSGEVIHSKRKDIWVFKSGPRLDTYSALHPAFVSQHLLIAEGLTLKNLEVRRIYREWMLANPATFGAPARAMDMDDLHNLYLYLLKCHRVDENDGTFLGVGIRPAPGGASKS